MVPICAFLPSFAGFSNADLRSRFLMAQTKHQLMADGRWMEMTFRGKTAFISAWSRENRVS
jgi:hypothetical protein